MKIETITGVSPRPRPNISVGHAKRAYVHGWARVAQRINKHESATEIRHRFEALVRRSGGLIVGALLIGLGVAFFVHSELGLAPYDVWLSAVSKHLGITLGQAAWISASVLFVVSWIAGQRLTLGSVMAVIVNGLAVDLFVGLVRTPDSFAVRLLFVGLGIASLAFGASLLLEKAQSGGPLELLTRAFTARGTNIAVARTCLEIGVLTAGVIGGGKFGLATVIAAVTIGPMLRRVLAIVDDHRLGRRMRLLDTHFATERAGVTVSST